MYRCFDYFVWYYENSKFVRFNFKTYMGEDESNFIQLLFNVVVLDLNEISNDCLNFIEFFKGRRFVSFRISSVYLILFEF